jgi:hypothetical protein
VGANSSDIRTFDLELPRGNATVKCGKFFEVRYFLNVIVGTSSKPKMVAVQLPIVLIHMNSLDVIPNSVAQVSAAFEEHRLLGRTPSTRSPKQVQYRSVNGVQGRAFAAPRKQSCDFPRDDLAEIGRVIQASPRRFKVERNRQTPAPPKSQQAGSHNDFKPLPHGNTDRQILGSISGLLKPEEPPRPLPPPRFKLSGLSQNSSSQNRSQALPSQSSLTSLSCRPTTIEEARERLRKMQSAILSRSNNSMFISGPTPIVYSQESDILASRSIDSQAFLHERPDVPALSSNSASIARPFRKMKSTDRWKTPTSWFERSRDRETEKGTGDWI